MEENENDGNLFEIMDQFFEKFPAFDAADGDVYLSFDDQLTCAESVGNTNEEIARAVLSEYQRQQQQQAGDDDEEDDEIECLENEQVASNVSLGDISRSFNLLKTFCLQKMPDFYENVFSLETAFNSAYAQAKLSNAKQANLEAFFGNNE